MPPRRLNCRYFLLGSVATFASASIAVAKDLPATPEGAAKITSFLETYAGKSSPDAPAKFTVTPEGGDYLISADLAAIMARAKPEGMTYDPAILKYKAFEQDDGAWRVEQEEMTTINTHAKHGDKVVDTSVAVSGLKNVMVIDPAISWVRSGLGSADNVAVRTHGTGLEEALDTGALKATVSTKASPDGVVSTNIRETIASPSMTLAIDPKAMKPDGDGDGDVNPNAKPINVSAKAGASVVTATIDGMKPRPLLDLWAFVVAHSSRTKLAADEGAFKTLLTAALATQTTVSEDIGAQKLSVETSKGVFTFDSAKLSLAMAAAGQASRFEQRIVGTGLALPPGLVPAPFQDLVPTSFDIGFKVAGFDLTAAGAEIIADLHLAGDAPPISPDDKKKVSAKLLGAGPLVIDIATSHLQAPQLDVSFEGQIRYLGGRPTGTITLHMRNFDQSVAALKSLGPDAERKMVPVVAMAKGLAKTDPDGMLTWVGEVGADRILKVNGLPLGKAPF